MAMTEARTLADELAAKYPHHEFDVSDKDECGCSDDGDAPQELVTFTAPRTQECIVDPLSEGFGPCDPLEVYGIGREDAERIRAHNRVVAA
jgi:hypothetical protein